MRIFSGPLKPKATVLGCEFAGDVEAVGSGVTSFAVGDQVFGYSEWPVRRARGVPDDAEDGSIATMPANVTYDEAASSTEGSHYALSAIHEGEES